MEEEISESSEYHFVYGPMVQHKIRTSNKISDAKAVLFNPVKYHPANQIKISHALKIVPFS